MITSRSSPNFSSLDTITGDTEESSKIKNTKIKNTKWSVYIPEPYVYMKGLPKTPYVTSLKNNLKGSIFGCNPTMIDIFTDENGISTGNAYIEFEDHNIKKVIKISNGYTLHYDNKEYTLLTTQCRERPRVSNRYYIYLEVFGAWVVDWSISDMDTI